MDNHGWMFIIWAAFILLLMATVTLVVMQP